MLIYVIMCWKRHVNDPNFIDVEVGCVLWELVDVRIEITIGWELEIELKYTSWDARDFHGCCNWSKCFCYHNDKFVEKWRK